MAQIQVKAAIMQKQFPMNVDNFVDTVLRDTGFEQERLVEGFDNQPQAFFLQNTLPQSRGYTSIHYTRVVSESSYPTYMDKILQLRNGEGAVALLAPCNGQNLIYSAVTGEWVSHPETVPLSSVCTIAYLKGVTYICYSGVGLFTYDIGTDTWSSVSLSGGITFGDIIGVASAGTYLILYTKQYVAYSSPTDPTDFTPVTGGGGQSAILATRGVITTVLPISNGIIVHTAANAVYGQLTGNVNFPFAFREIPNSSGVADSEHVTYDSTNDVHIALTSSGMMQVTPQKAELIWPELSDLIASKNLPGTGTAPSMVGYSSVDVKVSSIGSRYIAVSMKPSNVVEYRVSYVFDLGLGRWGVLNIPHIDLFEYRNPEFTRIWTYDELTQVYDTYTQTYDNLGEVIESQAAKFGATFGCVSKLGAVFVALTSDYADVALLKSEAGAETPRIVLGKYRIVRKQSCIVHAVNADKLQDAEVTLLGHDVAGDTIKTKLLVSSSREPTTRLGRCNGSAVSVSISGRFSLTSLGITFEQVGSGLLPVRSSDDAIPDNIVVVDTIPVVIDGEYVVS